MTAALRLVFATLYYWPDEGAAPRLLTELAEDCAASGAHVRVLTSRGRYRRFENLSLSRLEERHGVIVERLWSTQFGSSTVFGRICDAVSFFLTVGIRLLKSSQHDILVCASLPPMVGFVVGLVARLRHRRFVYKVEDVFPDLALALGVLKPGLVTWLARRASAFALESAAAVVAIDPLMQVRLAAAAPGARITTIPNWADLDALRPGPEARQRFREANHLESRFLVLYSGNLGRVHAFAEVLEAARMLHAEGSRAFFLFIGDGPRLEEARRAGAGLANVAFRPFLPPENVPASHSAADVILVTLDRRAEGLAVPSKLYTGLAAGRPILYVCPGRDGMADAIRRADVGWVVPPDPAAVATAVRAAAGDEAENQARGERAQRLLVECFDRRHCAARWMALFEHVAATLILRDGRKKKPS